MIRGALLAMAAASALAIAGCGLGPGPGTGDVSVTVTRDFGSHELAHTTQGRIPGSETVMRLLERHFRVSTRYGGGFVQAINGVSGSASRVDWFFYVNGIQAPMGAAVTTLHHGDRVWWDLHDWRAAESIPAVVGSFPEPFLHGVGGRRLPTAIECASDVGPACQRVSKQLAALGVPVATQLIGTGSGTDSLAVVVGTWRDIRPEILGSLIDQGPASSGVYARFGQGTNLLDLLNPQGHVVRQLGSGAGLIAATAQGSDQPTWLVTGTDVAGVSAAAAAFTPNALDNHFALAVSGTSHFPLPLAPGT